MTFLSARRAVLVVAAAVAAIAALALPGIASAKAPVTDLGEQCSGSNIEMLGSTFQAPIDFVWTGVNSDKGNEVLHTGFNVNTNALACQGTKGTKKTEGKPTVYDNQESKERGSGACLKDFGANGGTLRTTRFPICGTDEAPSVPIKLEMEAHGVGQESESIDTVPVLQGAVAVIVHLPEHCTASSEPVVKGKVKKIGRLSLDQSVVAGIYTGTIKTWKAAVEEQHGDASDKLKCESPSEETDTIHPVVRVDKSGTTHIFKSFLEQVDTTPFKAEKFNEVNGEKPCGEAKEEEEKTWTQVAEGCENQRWPAAAEVTRNEENETGNPGVVKQVNKEQSSIGYADLAVARELKYFSSPAEGGGEVKAGEKHAKFWAYVQNDPHGATPEYQEPASGGDNEKLADSNCADTVYAAREGEGFPPKSVRSDWSPVKGERESKTYPICGLTYLLAYRAYYYYLHPQGLEEAESKAVATTAENFLKFAVASAAGGKEAASKRDYDALPSAVKKVAEEGIVEIGNKKA
jgi:ABC-type phosphate transport system substrate-binding protein